MKKSLFFFLFISSLYGQWAERTLQDMSLDEKLGQLFMVVSTSLPGATQELLASRKLKNPYRLDQDYIEELITDYHVGGLIFNYSNSPAAQVDCTNRFQAMSSIPLLVGQDCEWGLSMRHPGTIRFPRNMTLAAMNDKDLLHEVGKEIGRQCKAIGVHINFAPVVDVNNNPKNPVINDRSFGDQKEFVAASAIAFMRGMQEAGILACAKHFPGHGDTCTDSHCDLPVISHDRTRLNDIELYPFRKIIKAGVDAIMSAHLHIPALDSWPNQPATLSSNVMTDLLQKELGFEGIIVTDGMGMEGITKHFEPGHAECEAILAGVDMVVCPVDAVRAIDLLKEAVAEGRLSQEGLDRRVLKILRVKEKLGLDKNRMIDKATALQSLESAEASDLKRRLYEKAVTAVRGNLSFTRDQSHVIIQIGNAPDDRFMKMLHEAGIEVIQYPKNVDQQEMMEKVKDAERVVVAIFEMNKLAGQRFGLSEETLQALNTLKRLKKRVDAVLFGNPYSVPIFFKMDSVLVAYEDDPDAQTAAVNILLAKKKAEGRLPISL